MITSEQQPLTVSEVAAILGVHVNTVKRIPAAGLLYFRVSGRGDRRYFPGDVEAYIERNTVRR